MASYGAKKPAGSHEPDKNIQEMRKQVKIYEIIFSFYPVYLIFNMFILGNKSDYLIAILYR